MEKLKIKTLALKILKIFVWVFLILLAGFIVLSITRIPHVLEAQKTEAQIIKIHSTKLQMKDVTGENLPPVPGVEADKTLQGVDANLNGIRDDVELAIFKEYPKSAKTRAVLLQYAMVLQMETTQPFINEEIATSIAEKDSQSYDCIGEIVLKSKDDLIIIDNYLNFIKGKQFNTIERKKMKVDFDNKVRSFELKSGCDIDLSILSN